MQNKGRRGIAADTAWRTSTSSLQANPEEGENTSSKSPPGVHQEHLDTG